MFELANVLRVWCFVDRCVHVYACVEGYGTHIATVLSNEAVQKILRGECNQELFSYLWNECGDYELF